MINYSISSKTNRWSRHVKKVDNIINQVLLHKKNSNFSATSFICTNTLHVESVATNLNEQFNSTSNEEWGSPNNHASRNLIIPQTAPPIPNSSTGTFVIRPNLVYGNGTVILVINQNKTTRILAPRNFCVPSPQN